MSPSIAARPRAPKASWSVATRLTAWYAGSAFGLVVVATGLLYWALIHSLDRADDRLLADKVRVLQAILLKSPYDDAPIRQEVEEAWKARRDTQVYVRILDASGHVITETPTMGQVLPATAFPAPTAEPGEGSDLRRGKDRIFRVLASQVVPADPKSPSHVVQVGTDRSQEFDLLADYRRNLWGVLGVALILCAVVGHQIARRGMEPVHDITETARRIRAANLGERITADGLPTELLDLADTFNHMLDRLEQSFARISRFSGDIAHELRTPLNNLRGEIEVALGKRRSPEDYSEILGSCLEECGRLARLIDSLLFLARSETPQAVIAKNRLDLGIELSTVCEFCDAAASEAGVRLTVAAQDHVMAELNRLLFQRAMGNLVANALAHTPPGGSVTLAARRDVGGAVVDVIDTGCGIAAEHLPHVFDRFYRVDQARRSGENGHVGLGLALVKSIVELHGGTAEIFSELGRGTRVALHFPER